MITRFALSLTLATAALALSGCQKSDATAATTSGGKLAAVAPPAGKPWTEVIASNADWTRATHGPEPAAREAFYKQVQALIDAGK